jgi:hypothetical protein
LKRFNDEMLKVKELLESIALEILIKGVNKYTLWRKIYILPERNLLKVKQVMGNHIQVEKANYYNIDPLFITWTTKDLPSEIILLVEMNARGITLRD